jgi:hypothetical protein
MSTPAVTLSMATVLVPLLSMVFFFWHIMQVDGALKKATGSSQIALGSEEEVHRVARPVNSAVEVIPLIGYFDIGLVKPPALSNWLFASPKD